MNSRHPLEDYLKEQELAKDLVTLTIETMDKLDLTDLRKLAMFIDLEIDRRRYNDLLND